MSPVTPCLAHEPDHVARQQVVDEYDMCTDREPGRELAEPGVEAERQHREDDVVLVVAEVLADALAADQQVAVREHHPLRLTGASGCVEDRRHLDIDQIRLRRVIDAAELAPAVPFVGAHRHRIRGAADHDHVLDRRAVAQLVVEHLEPLRGGHQHANTAVAEDVADLVCAQQGINRDEDAGSG